MIKKSGTGSPKQRKLLQTRRFSARSLVAALAVVIALPAIGISATKFAHGASFASMCTNDSVKLCVNRKGYGSGVNTPIIGWGVDNGANEYVSIKYINPCNSHAGQSGETGPDQVTPTCPFVQGYGYNSGSVGDEIVQIQLLGSSGNLLGCVGGTNAAGLQPCGGGGLNNSGIGTIFVVGGNNRNGIPANEFASRNGTDSNPINGPYGLGATYKGGPIYVNLQLGPSQPGLHWHIGSN